MSQINHTDGFKVSTSSNLLDLVRQADISRIEEHLKKSPSSIHDTDDRGQTALHIAAIRLRDLSVFKLLVQYGVQSDASDDQQETALRLAVSDYRTDPQVSRYLVSIAPHLMDQIGPDGSSMLHYAIMRERRELVEFMLDQGASVTCKSRFNLNALHFAAAMDDVKTLEACIQQGADARSLTLAGESAYDVAISNQAHAAAEYLKQVELSLTEKEELTKLIPQSSDEAGFLGTFLSAPKRVL